MDTWYRLPLCDGLDALGCAERLAPQFERACRAAPDPGALAVYTQHVSDGRLHCEVHAWFNPAAAALARSLGAEPSPAPDPACLDPILPAAGRDAGTVTPAASPRDR